jgi:hypothetical protein
LLHEVGLFPFELELCFVNIRREFGEHFSVVLGNLGDFVVSLEDLGVAADGFFSVGFFDEEGLGSALLPKASFMGNTMDLTCRDRVCLGGGLIVVANDSHVDGL